MPKMEEEQIKNHIQGLINQDDTFKRSYEGDFLTRDTYFCLEDNENNKFMVIIKSI
jgi:hypothetical protein